MELTLDVTQESFEKAGSKFITFAPADAIGTQYFKEVELGVADWDNPGISIKFPITIIGPEGDPDIGKQDKLSAGVAENALWKLKEILKALGIPITYKVGIDKKKHPVFETDDVAGKKAVGCWELQLGSKGGDAAKGGVKYPKLVSIFPEGYKPSKQALV